KDAVTMVEAGANEVSEAQILAAIQKGHEVIREICALQEELVRQCGKPKIEVEPPPDHSELKGTLRERYRGRLEEALLTAGKHASKSAVQKVVTESLGEVSPAPAEGEEPRADLPVRALVKSLLEGLSSEGERELFLSGRRTDGRRWDEIRPIALEVGTLP